MELIYLSNKLVRLIITVLSLDSMHENLLSNFIHTLYLHDYDIFLSLFDGGSEDGGPRRRQSESQEAKVN